MPKDLDDGGGQRAQREAITRRHRGRRRAVLGAGVVVAGAEEHSGETA